MFSRVLLLGCLAAEVALVVSGGPVSAYGSQIPGPGKFATESLRIVTGHPGSVIFINNIRHGVTSDTGILDLPEIKPGTFSVRVRTVGYADWSGRASVTTGSSRTLKITQQPTGDQAVLHYQKGDELRDKGKNADAVNEYKDALTLRPAFPEAHIAFTRSLITLQKFDEAEDHIQAALNKPGTRLVEAQTVLANMRRSQGLVDEAIVEYRKALRLARGVSPEAHVGLALALEEAGKMDDAIKELRIGVAQDMDTEPILYYLLGSALEKQSRNREAIEAYRKYLQLDPQGQYASAVESMIERLKQ